MYTIGKLAEQASINVETVRYYERRGLIEKPEKPHLGYRLYPLATLNRIKFIKRSQDLGFTLEEISNLRVMVISGVWGDRRMAYPVD